MHFGWFGGAPILFRRRWHIPFSAGGGSWIQRLRGLSHMTDKVVHKAKSLKEKQKAIRGQNSPSAIV